MKTITGEGTSCSLSNFPEVSQRYRSVSEEDPEGAQHAKLLGAVSSTLARPGVKLFGRTQREQARDEKDLYRENEAKHFAIK